ncbi:DUF4124 domain-containing protein [Stenotrophomonas sp. MMGLT7]|uniref:DUF4124 domain-containing protein n=1 Tax=Stenotrophomonas sp. MMGLT7 TaxID=2901227 RepID=UPI001E5A4362|nr:DUF4124 domain-containing protein [Stenotrophomonas sp. MMGLT7]MCD7098395.1 DUF4124 domain-containing protein [Stenotrophomonas sp. MMGLT7]
MKRWSLPCWLALLAPLPAAAGAPPPAGDLTVYRCVDGQGRLSLGDAPCPTGQRQQVLSMQRPQDPPPRRPTAPATAAATTAVPPREVRIVSVQPPQPMYECVTADGERYTSDDDDGNPRWVPSWGLGYVARPGRPANPAPGTRPGPPPPRPGGVSAIVPIGNVLVRDACHALPRQEACSRLRDRRWELIRRYNSALQSEREALVREQRGVDARLDQDCGGA